VNTGRVIHRRYLLQNIIERGTACVIYQGDDQVLLRTVAVKIVPAQDVPAYRAAIRATAQFSHPNIIGLFDLIVEPENLYIVQEHVKGDDFATLLRSHPTPSQVADLGIQICQALIYAGSSSHKICHGDLTPSSIIRDSEGHVRINNFALPSDTAYFSAWSVVGDNGFGLSDPELPYGQISEGRRSDDARAVGLLLYQLLASRPADATKVEPPMDGILRFQRNVPRDLCEVIARAIMRTHPQRILTAESLYSELKHITETLEPVPVPEVIASPAEEVARLQPFPPSPLPQPRPAMSTGQLVSTLPSRDLAFDSPLIRRDDVSRTTADVPHSPAMSSPVSDMSMKLVAARAAAYPTLSQTETGPAKINLPAIILMCLIFFAIFFAVGFFIAQVVFP
jgi:serine/threonine protein kinase